MLVTFRAYCARKAVSMWRWMRKNMNTLAHSLTHSLPLQQAAKVSRLENFRTEVNPISLKTCCLCELPQPKSTSDSNVYGFLVEQMVWKNVISWFTAKRHNLTAGVIVFIWTLSFARNWLTKYFHESIKTLFGLYGQSIILNFICTLNEGRPYIHRLACSICSQSTVAIVDVD